MYRVRIKPGDVAVFEVNGRELTVEVMDITPKMARQIIDESDTKFKNRESKRATVENYKKNLRDGLWANNGEPITFREDGALTNGRHRLTALSELGDDEIDSLQFIAIGNVEPGVEHTFDIGRQRTLNDGLEFTGIHKEANVASILQLKAKLDGGRRCTMASLNSCGVNRPDLIKTFEEENDLYNDAAIYGKAVEQLSGKTLGCIEVGAFYLHLTETLGYDESVVKDFFNRLATAPRSGKTIFVRATNKLSEHGKFRRGSTRRTNLFIQCWNSYVAGRIINNVSIDKGDWFNEPTNEIVVNTASNSSRAAKQQKSLFD